MRGDCAAFSNLIVEPRTLLVDGNPDEIPAALRSAIILDGPGTIQESFKTYKNTNFTLSQIKDMLVTWRQKFFQVSIKYN